MCTPDVPKDATCYGVFGHRVGLCQQGAIAMAKCSASYDQILAHYFTDIELANLPEATPEYGPEEPETAVEPAAEDAAPQPEAEPEPLADVGTDAAVQSDTEGASVGSTDDGCASASIPCTAPLLPLWLGFAFVWVARRSR